MLHKSKGVLWLLSAFAVVTLSACATNRPSQRMPSSQTQDARLAEEAAYEEKKSQFYLDMIPPSDRNRLDLMAFAKAAQEICGKSDYARFIAGLESTEARNAFLLKRLNRTFYFANVKDRDGKSYSLGRTSDISDLMCISVTLAGGFGPNGMPKETVIEPDFIEAALALPSTNFAVLDMMINSWNEGSHNDLRIAQLIFNHQALNIYSAEEVIKKLFRKNFDRNTRKGILSIILKSSVFTSSQHFFGKVLVRNLQTAQISSAENYDLIHYLAQTLPDLVPPNEILALAARKPNPATDYRSLFLTISKNETQENKISLLLEFFESDFEFSASDEEFRKLLSPETLPLLLPFALNFSSASKRISADTIYHVITTSLNQTSLRPNELRGVLDIVRDRQAFDLSKRMTLYESACKQRNVDAEVAKTILYNGEFIRRESPQLESRILNCVTGVVHRFLPGESLVNDYASFVRHLASKEAKLKISEGLLRTYSLEDGFLRDIADEALARGKTNVTLMELILKQNSLTEHTLDQISINLSNRMGGLSQEEKQVIELIKKHPLATEKMRARLDRALKGGWQQLDPSDLDWNKK